MTHWTPLNDPGGMIQASWRALTLVSMAIVAGLLALSGAALGVLGWPAWALLFSTAGVSLAVPTIIAGQYHYLP